MVDRKYQLPFAELIDRLTIDQIKEVELPAKRDSIRQELALLFHDIDQLVGERQLRLSARLIATVGALAQLNVTIWKLKDRMVESDDNYLERLKLAHQLNGIRNQLKNNLMRECGDLAETAERTNYNVDGLEGWDLFVLGPDDRRP